MEGIDCAHWPLFWDMTPAGDFIDPRADVAMHNQFDAEYCRTIGLEPFDSDSAYREGKAGFDKGLEAIDNPYPDGSKEENDWFAGWNDALMDELHLKMLKNF